MSVETMPTTEDLGSLDWSIPCGMLYHGHQVVSDEAAAWAVWQHVPCGCGKRPDFGYACDPCLQYALTVYACAGCRDCGWFDRTILVRDVIVRIEALRP